MTNNKKLLKGLLAGASALTVVMGSANIASAAAVNVAAAGPTSTLARGGALTIVGNGGWGTANTATNAGDWIHFGTAGPLALTIDQTGAVIQGIDTDKGGSIITNATTVSIGSMYDKTTGNNGAFTITVGAGNTLTFTGTAFNGGNTNSYANAGATKLGSGSTLSLASTQVAALTLVGGTTIDGAAANNGTLLISTANGAVTVGGTVGATNSLAAVNITNATNTTAFSLATKTRIINNSDAANNGATTFTGLVSSDADLAITSGKGAMSFNAGITAATNLAITGGVGLVTVAGAAATTTAGAMTITGGAGGVTTAAITVGGANDLTVTTGTGAVTMAAITSGRDVVFAAGGTGAIIAGGVITAQRNITIDASAHTVDVTGVVSTVANNGDIIVSNATNAVTFTVAPAANGTGSLKVGAGAGGVILSAGITDNIQFTGDGKVTLATTQNINGNITTTTTNNGTITIVAGVGSTITGTVGASGKALKALTSNAAGGTTHTVTADVYAATTTVNAGILALGGNLTGALNFAADGTVTLAAGKNITGNITTTTTSNGTITLADGNTTITGTVGASDKVLKVLTSAATVNNTTTVTGDIYAATVTANTGTLALQGNLTGALNFAADGKVTLGADANITGAITTIAGAGNGTITVADGDSTIKGTVGVAGNVLKALTSNVGAGNTHTVTGAIYAATTTVGGVGTLALSDSLTGALNFAADGTVTLASGKSITGAITTAADNTGTISGASGLTAGNTVTLTGAVGASGSALAAVDVGAAKLVTTSNLFAHSVTAGTITLGAGNTNIVYTDGGKIVVAGANKFLGTTGGFVTNLGKLASFQVTGANTATFEDGVDLNATAITGTGTLTFSGTHAVTGPIGSSGAAAAAINVATAATFTGGDIYSTAGIVFTANGTANLAGNLKVGGVATIAGTVANGGSGTVNFTNAQGTAVVVDGSVGTAANALKLVQVGAGDVVFSKAANMGVASVKFANDSTLTLTGYAGNTGTAFTTATLNTGTVALTVDAIVGTDAYGTAGNPLKAIQLAGTKFGVDKVVYADIKTTANNSGTVNITASKVTDVYGLGDATNSLATVEVTGSGATLHKNVYARNINFVAANAADTLGVEGALNGNFNFTATGGTLNVLDGCSIGAVTSAAPTGTLATINFAGAGALNGQVGSASNELAAVNFKGAEGKVAKVSNDVYAASITQAAGIVELQNNVTFNGAYNLNGGTVSVGQKTLTVTGLTTATGVVTLAITTDGTQAGTGKLALSGADFSADSTSQSAITIISNTLPENNTKLTILTVSGTDAKSLAALSAFDSDKATVNFANKYITVGVDQGVATITRDTSSIKTSVASSGGTEGGNDLAAGFANQNVTGQAAIILNDLGAEGVTDAEVANVINRLAATGPGAASQANGKVVGYTSSALGVRLNVVTNASLASADKAGVAAGDAATNLGAWGSVFGGRGTQQSYKEVVGFKSNVQGGIIGFDAAINDSTIIGVAATMAQTKVKFKDIKVGDKTKATSYLFAGYGVHEFGNNWLVQGAAMMGNSSIKNTSLLGVGNTLVGTGKFDSMSYSAEVLGGYRFNTGETGSVIPMTGLRFVRTTDSAYTVTGAGAYNTSSKEVSRDKVVGVIGARASMTTEIENMAITPEFHASMDYDFKAKAPKVDVRLNGLTGSIATKGSKPSKVTWNLGTSVTAASGAMEYGIGYDSQLSNKYIGHQGSLKVRVNF
ncbi:MAG: autotransporter domain-containing protein [Pseudomonadota bacterium]